MAHDIWKGVIGFGLVEVPVSLVAADNPAGLSLSYLDRRDSAPVGYRRYNKVTGEEVDWDDIVHGYEYEKGEYVVLGKEDLKRANPELTGTIQILRFVDASSVDPVYFDKPYYVEPQKPRSKGYVLLREALRSMEKVGIATVVLRTREHVAALAVRDNALVLHLLRFSNEIRDTKDLDNVDFELKDVKASKTELQMAQRLIEDMSGEFDPSEFRDDYREDLLKLIERKIKAGKTRVIEREPSKRTPRQREVIDLMPLLRRSLAAAKKGGKRAPERAHAGRGAAKRTARRRSA